MKRVDRPMRNETYAVLGGELLLNGTALPLPDRCLDLCMARQGLDPKSDHRRLPFMIGRYILRIGAFAQTIALARSQGAEKPRRRS